MARKAEYRWKITRDRLENDPEYSDRGVEGPGNLDEDLWSNATRFSMYDDDGVCYYEGMLYGDFVGFEPLDDFGTPNAGCTTIKVDGEWL
jgi:hypothetical protein